MTEKLGWVMCGMQAETGVTLFASNALTSAELEEDIDFGDVWAQMDGRIYPHRRLISLAATTDRMVVIQAADWPAAFRALFKTWSPEPMQRELTR